MPPRSHTHPSLPQSLLEEINGDSGSAHKHKRKGGQQLSRKEARKQARDSRKQRKAEHFLARPAAENRHHGKRIAEDDHADSPQRKKAKLEVSPRQPAPATSTKTALPKASQKVNKKKDDEKTRNVKTALEKLAERSNAPASSKSPAKSSLKAMLRTPQEEEEDAYIAYMERKLGWVKGGKRTTKYGAGDEDDGLGDLLEGLDAFEASMPSFADEDFEASDPSDYEEEGVQEESDVEDEDEAEGQSEESSSVEKDSSGEGEWLGFGGDDEKLDEDDGDVRNEAGRGQAVMDSLDTENKPQASVAGTKYVPPHLRKLAQSGVEQPSESQLKLTRQLKGLLNRMSEQNIASIVDGVEELYRNNRRHDVTETLTTLLVDGISSHSMLLDQYVVLHAAFVSALHRLVGIEFAAFFVQHVVSSYDTHFAAIQDLDVTLSEQTTGDEPAGKECSNLVVLLSELYNFQMISCVLIYDIIRVLLDGDLTEFKVELLLKVVRNSGQQLRQDDPTALKSIIQIVHSKLPQDTSSLSSRARFMVETLGNLKNNKVKKAAGQTAGGEAVERMKKFLSGLAKKRHVMSHDALRVSLEDLRSADTKGRWWLVGAAWGGDPLVEHQQASQNHTEGVPTPDTPSENVLLKLAKKQGMNTDIRRSIFVVLMSSDDYVDACERVSQLKLTEIQQREIIRVILHCCGNERQYNPYYALVGQQLCRLSHSHRFTLQFCLWDFLRDLGETTVGGAEILKNLTDDDRAGFTVKSMSDTRIRNVARAFGWWIAKDCCTLSVLKPVDFAALKKPARAFMRELFVHVFANTQLATPWLASQDLPGARDKGALEDVFLKGAKLHALALGLTYYLREAFKAEDGFLDWASQIALQVLQSSVDVM